MGGCAGLSGSLSRGFDQTSLAAIFSLVVQFFVVSSIFSHTAHACLCGTFLTQLGGPRVRRTVCTQEDSLVGNSVFVLQESAAERQPSLSTGWQSPCQFIFRRAICYCGDRVSAGALKLLRKEATKSDVVLDSESANFE